MRKLLAAIVKVVTVVAAVSLVGGLIGSTAARADGVTRIIAPVIRDEAEFLAVFGFRPTKNQLSEALSLTNRGRANGWNMLAPTAGIRLSNQVYSQYQQAARAGDTAFVLVGHNRLGSFMLPDGSQLALSTIADWRKPGGPIPAVLSCASRQYVGNNAVTLEDAVSANVANSTADYIQNALANSNISPDDLTVDQFQAITDRGLSIALANANVPGANRTLKIVGGTTAGAAVVSVAVVIDRTS